MKFSNLTSIALVLAVISALAKADEPKESRSPESRNAPSILPAPDPVSRPHSSSAPAPKTRPATDGVLTPKMQPQSVTVALINGSTLVGTISEADQWTMKTSFGTANLPLSAVAGIHM